MLSRLPLLLLVLCSFGQAGEVRTWDGRHSTSHIEVTVVYFVPSDRQPLVDWQDRANYYRRRIEQFHHREFQGQSKLTTVLHPEPLVSESTTDQLRVGDANRIFFRTLREADQKLKFGNDADNVFPILLVLSEINWRPLDDFFRVRPEGDSFAFEGNYNRGQHFPGATSGGARATYLADRGVGWGLVSADGWRVPYRGSDCVVYHEGCGHTVGLPHPEPGNASVMSLGQYNGWISESWLDKDQKARLGWEPIADYEADLQTRLYSSFRALTEPGVPAPGEDILLKLDWPEEAIELDAIRVRYQTSLHGPWTEVSLDHTTEPPEHILLGSFDRAIPVSYRVDVTLKTGETAELWGYFQVRNAPNQHPVPRLLSPDLIPGAPVSTASLPEAVGETINLLEKADPASAWKVGEWKKQDGKIESPKRYGARMELPYNPSGDYRLTAIVEPLDDPNGLLFGQQCDGNRFVTLFNFATGGSHLSAIEDIDGKNVGNESTHDRALFRKNQLSEVIVTVQGKRVVMMVDGRVIADWTGSVDQLTLSDYWSTPNLGLFLGAYDCRYRFHRLTLQLLE